LGHKADIRSNSSSYNEVVSSTSIPVYIKFKPEEFEYVRILKVEI